MCCLITGLSGTLAMGAVEAAEAEPEAPAAVELPEISEDPNQLEEVVVYGTSGRLVAGLHAETELGEEDLAAYGANTVGDLLSKVVPDIDSSEQGPVILINGRPAAGIRSVNDLPPEVVARMQVLPPQAASAIGEDPNRRVINVVLRPELRQGTGNLTAKGSTAGRGFSSNADFSMVKLKGNNFDNLSLQVQKIEPLLEAHRNIVSVPLGVPYDLQGNVVPWPATGSEIDANLSAMAGETVTVAGIPAGMTAPTLGDFLPLANTPNTSDVGRYRTLIGDSYNLGMNGNLSRSLPRNISFNLNAYLSHNESSSLTGITPSLLHVPSASPFSPFASDVSVARYLGGPLHQDGTRTQGNVSANFNLQLGKWRLMTDTSFGLQRSVTDSERRVDTGGMQAAIDAGTLNPFEEFPVETLGEMLSDRARGRGHSLSTRLQISGALFDLPAGRANANLSAQLQRSEQRSRTTGTINITSNRKRTDMVANGSLQLPLLGNPTPQGFAVGAELNGSARDVSGSGTMVNWGTGLNWRYSNRGNLRVAFNRENVAPYPEALSAPIVTIDDYRTYDFIRQETVLVRYITGGFPDLRTEKRNIINASGQIRPFKAIDFTLNAQYTRTMYYDPMSGLPAPSEAVQAAFPDRFRRDAEGRLYEVDARMVNFERTRNEQLRIGGSFRRTFGATSGAASPGTAISSGQIITSGDLPASFMMAQGAESLSGAGWRLNANFNHQWQLAYKRLMRPGVPVVDLVAGGAGSGTGQPRHRFQSTIGLAYNGTGLQLNGGWSSATYIIAGTSTDPTRIDFGSVLRFNLQAFTNLGTLYPASKPLKGVRISLTVDNLLDQKQRVTDQNGETPLRYQPWLIDSLGRVVSLSFRKAFGS